MTVETVVKPGDETTDSQKTDADIVQLVEQLRYVLTVTADGVEEWGHAEAEDGADKEEQEDELLGECDVIVALVTQRLHVEDDRHRDEGYQAWKKYSLKISMQKQKIFRNLENK